jgi:hypothetical protein
MEQWLTSYLTVRQQRVTKKSANVQVNQPKYEHLITSQLANMLRTEQRTHLERQKMLKTVTFSLFTFANKTGSSLNVTSSLTKGVAILDSEEKNIHTSHCRFSTKRPRSFNLFT